MSFFPPIYLDTKKRRRIRAFSLVELLIAVSIFAVVSVAIYSTFSSGLNVLRRVKDVDLAQQSFILKQERFHKELRQTIVLRKPLFLGTKDRVSFGAIVDEYPCRLTYYFDSSSQSLMRNCDKLADIITSAGKIDKELKTKPAVFINKVKELNFSYLYLDLKKNIYQWEEEWKQDFLPLAVKIEISTDKQNYETTVFLPTA